MKPFRRSLCLLSVVVPTGVLLGLAVAVTAPPPLGVAATLSVILSGVVGVGAGFLDAVQREGVSR